MSIEVKVDKTLDAFRLQIDFQSDSKRIGILGSSGCGKTLTLQAIAGILKPDAGRIAVNGRVLYDGRERICEPPQKRRVGYLFQNYALFPHMTVEKNIGIGLSCGKVEKEKKVKEMMERFYLQGLEKRFPSELSGGQQQRVALARILIYEPDIILLDEPFSALDVYLKEKMIGECMEFLRDYDGTVIFVSHSREEIYRFSEEAMVIADGKIIVQKPVKELFTNPERFQAARLIGCHNIVKKSSTEGFGIFAYDFVSKKEEGKSYVSFPVLDAKVTEELEEYTVSFLPAKDGKNRFLWKIRKNVWNGMENGLPKEIYVEKRKILPLR